MVGRAIDIPELGSKSEGADVHSDVHSEVRSGYRSAASSASATSDASDLAASEAWTEFGEAVEAWAGIVADKY
jgi:hypothetical protein